MPAMQMVIREKILVCLSHSMRLMRGKQDSCSELQTANLIKDIRVERFHKIDKGLKALEGPITVKLNNVSAMECNMIRHFFQGALNHFYKLAQVRTPLLCLTGQFCA